MIVLSGISQIACIIVPVPNNSGDRAMRKIAVATIAGSFFLIALTPGIVLLLSSPAHAQTERWLAAKMAEAAITGNVTLRENSVTFGNGKRLTMTPVGGLSDSWTPTGDRDSGTIYRLTTPSSPVLLNGNKLCHARNPVTYIVIVRMQRGMMGLIAFTGDKPPHGFNNDPCATYFYER
jgi:hypothetical protein